MVLKFLSLSRRLAPELGWKVGTRSAQGRHCRAPPLQPYGWFSEWGFELVQHAFAPRGGGRIEDAARHRRPPRFLGVGCTEEGIVDRRRLGFWMVFGRFSERMSRSEDFTDFRKKSNHFPDLV